MFISIGGKQMYLWRAVDDEGAMLDVLVPAKRDKQAALKLMRKIAPESQLQHLLPSAN